MKSLLIAWDFNGVLNVLAEQAGPVMMQLQSHGAEQIVVSSSLPGTIEQYLQRYDLDGYISQVYGFAPNTLQWVGDSATMKEDVLQHHVRKFGPYERVVVVGDSESDMRAGQQVQAETVLFSDGPVSFETIANHVAHTADELLAVVLG